MNLDKEDLKYLISAIDRDVRAQGLIVTPRALRIAQILQAVLEPPAPVAVAEPESVAKGYHPDTVMPGEPPEEPPVVDDGH